eukprot:2623561-Pyramimonas_sp.AAC.1
MFTNRGAYGQVGLVKPPGQPDRRCAAGAGESDPSAAITTYAQVLQNGQEQQHLDNMRLLQAVGSLRRSGEEEKVAQRGTLGAIGRAEELDVYLDVE